MLEPLTTERIRELWSRTYNREGKPDWSHIFPYYHDDIIFEDSIQRVEGKADIHGDVRSIGRTLRAAQHGHPHPWR